MRKNLGLKLLAVMLLVALAISFASHSVEAGRPRGGGNLRYKYTGKFITGIRVGPWSPWRLTSAEMICPNGLWSFDYTRWRAITKDYWLADRWLAWGWLDHNIVFYEHWKNWRGPFSYTIWQRQMKQVYWFDPLHYDPTWPWAIQQTFLRDTLLWADWTGINRIVHPLHGPVLQHRVFFDEVLYYDPGPGQPDGTDAMVISLADYDIGEHLIRIEVLYADGYFEPMFLMVPIVSINYIEATAPDIVLQVAPGNSYNFAGLLTVRNNLDEDRAVYFKVGDRSTGSFAESFFDVFFDIDVIGNGTTIIPGPHIDSFFDIFVCVPPHTPIGETIEVEIRAMTLEGLQAQGGGGGGAYSMAGHTARVRLKFVVVPPTHSLVVHPWPVALAGVNTIVLEGFGYPPNSEIGITSSFNDVIFGTAITDPAGYFKYEYPVPPEFNLIGEHAFAAINLNASVIANPVASATASIKIHGPDINGDGIVDIFDLVYLAKYYGLVLPPDPPGLTLALAGTSVAIVFPTGVLWLRKNRQRRLKTLEN